MFFNSLSFAIFLPIVFFLYWFVFNSSKKAQNTLLIIASYYFYSCWDWRFLFLLVFSTGLDYFTALKIENSRSKAERKTWFWISVGVNLGFLGVFKYYDFFAVSFSKLIEGFGMQANPFLLNLVLPVGISFYTFHGLSYIIDIYKERIRAERNFIDYALFVSYFPLLVAGPIERATHLLPQVKVKRSFDYQQAKEGIHQILWGLVKKIVIADSCAQYANAVFDNYESMNSLSLVLGAVYFAFQIYGDFSGYSDIALGTSKLFGINLLKNFDYPYFSRDIAEFWRRWHISLSSWFRDYLYIPLGGSQGGTWMKIRNTFIIFLVSGFWHGANWTFLAWGFLNALYFLPLLLSNKNRTHTGNIEGVSFIQGMKLIPQIGLTFALTCLAWIFFRARTITDAFGYIKRMFSNWQFKPQYFNIERYNFELVLMLVLFVGFEWFNRYKIEPISGKYSYPKICLAIIVLLLFGVYSEYKSFIYFQF
ncbi:D-alanyl-lipoteichoic acid acyltransferase DltB (MBOAT superfamily) [Flavobacterium endophyticum]|uniref:D-alanyl-lipoteichoic acid acyltransferase DltB (MBOAT superfamily) n=1 Tax=Flavobacterium endophyticum TaxID=1540163 RepID=A0A495MAQ6_9FLAO|nr:MBOAT family O-acyltransferase [Flavobacterium endophyticum]RKS21813.1 D-alanyl-lipoteichoic acid acyltransferase DltB (MBOAT superfamily) [Flavobacterium endophyticum]